jgi:Tol biopolymer transport system component
MPDPHVLAMDQRVRQSFVVSSGTDTGDRHLPPAGVSLLETAPRDATIGVSRCRCDTRPVLRMFPSLMAATVVSATLTASAAGRAAPEMRAGSTGSDLIAYSFRDFRANGGDDWEVFSFDPATGSERDLSRDPSCDDGYATWSPDRTMVAYTCSSLVKENLKLLTTVDVDGSGRHVWLRTKQALGDARFSPDGSRLATMIGNTLELVTIADGSAHPIVPGGGGGSAGEVAWSPDGSQLAFTRPKQRGVWLVNRDGSNLHELVASAALAGPLAWSPDGTTIAFEATEGRGIRLVSPEGSDLRLLTRSAGDRFFRISWSPDGGKLLYTTKGGSLTAIGADGRGPRQLAPAADAASWSPDGTQIAYAADLIGLRLINGDGTHRLQLSRVDQIVSVAWSS